MSDERVGQWVARVDEAGRDLTKWHHVESVIADEPITRCGRRLRAFGDTAFLYHFAAWTDSCKQCQPEAIAA
jgi:hypothetical protein